MSDELPQELILLTRAHCELAEARTFKDFKTIRDKAEVARIYAKSALLGLEVQIYAAELKLECERRAGEVLYEVEFSSGGRPANKNRSHVATSLEGLGINKSQSSRWQREAQVPEKEFQRYLAESRVARKEPTSQGLLRLAQRLQAGGPHWPAKHRSPKRKVGVKTNAQTTFDSPGITFPRAFEYSDEAACLITDLVNHHAQLAALLSEFCGEASVIRPREEQRRYVRRLLREMGEFLSMLQSKRQPDARSQRSGRM